MVPQPVTAARALATRVPGATYRLQLGPEFGFVQAAEWVDYLRQLGITDVYLSPPFTAAPESTHGYDVCSYSELNPRLGGKTGFDQLALRLKQAEVGLLLDMVPNHMGNDPANPWWRDVLEKGPHSQYADWFDVNWNPIDPTLRGRILLPVLEAPYAEVLENGKLKLVCNAGEFAVAYYERQFPLSPRSYKSLLEQLARSTSHSSAKITAQELLADPGLFLPSHSSDDGGFALLKQRIAGLLTSSEAWRATVEQLLGSLNGAPGRPRSFDGLHALLEQQHYRLAWWRIGPEEINYRRFFDVTQLVSARVELLPVFEAAHAMVGELIAGGSVTGLRIDHPDGLRAPAQYFHQLQERFGQTRPFFVVVEKILVGDELLPTDWSVHGTTGYDFLTRLNGLFVEQHNEAAFDFLYRQFTGMDDAFEHVARAGKQLVLKRSFVSESKALAHWLKALCGKSRYSQDLTLRSLIRGLGELLAGLPVYRTYITESTANVPPEQERHIQKAFHRAVTRCPEDRLACAFIRDMLLLHFPIDFDQQTKNEAKDFVMRFQQLSGPVMAKGVEDTAFYNYNRLVSLNEVGGDPDAFGTTVRQFHEHNRIKHESWPHSLLATATHDTKRGEDTRARINVLSEMPQEWGAAIGHWHDLNSRGSSRASAAKALALNDEYLFYQVLLGAWPFDAETRQGREKFKARLTEYMLKAVRESKAHTSWTEPDKHYEEAVTNFVRHALRGEDTEFLQSFRRLQQEVAWFGHLNSLSQVLLKLTSPGVPDLYQGTELWDLSLVDPDNRRPVEYAVRQKLLNEIQRGYDRDRPPLLRGLLQDWQTGAVKLFLTWRLLSFRKANPLLFSEGAYEPLMLKGEKKKHVCAFLREAKGQSCVSVAPRLVRGLCQRALKLPLGPDTWADTVLVLPKKARNRQFENVVTGEIILPSEPGRLGLSDVLASFPVALLQPVV